MAEEPDNIVLQRLREMRERLDQLDEIRRTLDRMDKRLTEMNETMITALGLAANANLRHDGVQEQIEELAARLTRLEARVR